jgi:hypothetical protein
MVLHRPVELATLIRHVSQAVLLRGHSGYNLKINREVLKAQ